MECILVFNGVESILKANLSVVSNSKINNWETSEIKHLTPHRINGLTLTLYQENDDIDNL